MTNALTETYWIKVLNRVVSDSGSDTTRTLAKMLLDIIDDPADIGGVLDAYGSKLLEGAP
jgi:hypothetical protein